MLWNWWEPIVGTWICSWNLVQQRLLCWLWLMQWCCSKWPQGSLVWSMWNVEPHWMFISDTEYRTLVNSSCSWPKMWSFEIFWLILFFSELIELEYQSRFEPLSREKGDKSPTPDTTKPSFIKWLKFCSININGIRGKILEFLAFLDAHQPHVVAIQETKIDRAITSSELFPETCMYSVYRKDRNTRGSGLILLIHRDISHMPIMELENNSELVWVEIFKINLLTM